MGRGSRYARKKKFSPELTNVNPDANATIIKVLVNRLVDPGTLFCIQPFLDQQRTANVKAAYVQSARDLLAKNSVPKHTQKCKTDILRAKVDFSARPQHDRNR